MSEATNVYIALSQHDLDYALENVGSDDLIITDLISEALNCSVVRPFISFDDEHQLAEAMKEWFHRLLKENYLSSDLYGYVNNFFECSLRPTIMFTEAIDKVAKEYQGAVFVLPYIRTHKKKYSTYFMAEHESAGVRLYNRSAVLGPYILDYVQDKYQYRFFKEQQFAVSQRVKNVTRIWGVFATRFSSDLRKNLKLHSTGKKAQRDTNLLLIVRTIGQASVIMPFLQNTSHKVEIVVADSSIDVGLFEFIESSVGEKPNITLVPRKKLGLFYVFKRYLSIFGQLLKRNEAKFNYKGLAFNFSQALSEVIVMSGSLKLYKEQIMRAIESVDNSKSGMLLSMEQKSPHAYIDSIIAKDVSLPSIQVKQCNQSYTPLPAPIFSDGFVCDTPEVLENFKLCWPDYSDRLFYIGTLQGITGEATDDLTKTSFENGVVKLCFFAGVHSEINVKTIHKIKKMDTQDVSFDLTVKLHPRDQFNYTNDFPDTEFISRQEMSFHQFCELFDMGVTYPSGVVGELMFNTLPFFIYKPDHRDYREIGSSFDPEGVMIAETENELLDILSKPTELKDHFLTVRSDFMHKSGLILDIKTIDSNITKLTQHLGDK